MENEQLKKGIKEIVDANKTMEETVLDKIVGQIVVRDNKLDAVGLIMKADPMGMGKTMIMKFSLNNSTFVEEVLLDLDFTQDMYVVQIKQKMAERIAERMLIENRNIVLHLKDRF